MIGCSLRYIYIKVNIMQRQTTSLDPLCCDKNFTILPFSWPLRHQLLPYSHTNFCLSACYSNPARTSLLHASYPSTNQIIPRHNLNQPKSHFLKSRIFPIENRELYYVINVSKKTILTWAT